MKSDFQSFNAVSLPSNDKVPKCLYFREYVLEDNEEAKDGDLKTKGAIAHYSSEFCRLDKILQNSQVSNETNLKIGLISKKHLEILKEERNKALNSLIF